MAVWTWDTVGEAREMVGEAREMAVGAEEMSVGVHIKTDLREREGVNSASDDRSLVRLGAKCLVNLSGARRLHELEVALLEGLVREDEVQASDKLLRHHRGDGNHGQSTVV